MDHIDSPHSSSPSTAASKARAFAFTVWRWLEEGARTAIWRAPRWENLQGGPLVIAALMVVHLLLTIAFQRLIIDGPALFYWQAIGGGWLAVALSVWACYLVRGATVSAPRRMTAPDTAALFTLALAQSCIVSAIMQPLFILLVRSSSGVSAQWILWLATVAWSLSAVLLLLWRGGNRHRPAMLAASFFVVAGVAMSYLARPAEYWFSPGGEESGEPNRPLALTQELMESQRELLLHRLAQLQAQRPGTIDLYAITFAPYEETVFKRESAMVAEVMADRFDGQGHTLQLVNHPDTATLWPWATPLNLQRAIRRAADLMDRKEDILFLHLTSHGASDGVLAAQFEPLSVPSLTPADLKRWLDEAGIQNRVISISACFSGGWVKALAGENTLVMSAADADHTSYGCGSKSDLTFFGRAMYDEQLRTSTLNFEQAHSAARDVIRRREIEAGKDDGYSNPQISMGNAMREKLGQLEQQLKK